MVLRIELVKDFFDAAGMGLGGAKEDGFAGQHAVGVFDGLFHELAHDQGVGALVDDLLFKLSAFEVDVFNLFALQDELLLVFERNGTLADALHLELGLDLHDLKVAQIRRHVVDGFLVGVGKGGQAVFAVEQLKGVVGDDVG